MNNLNFTQRNDFNGDYKLCQEKFLLAEQHKKDGLVQPVAQGKHKTDAKKNGSNQKKTRFESGTKQPGKKHKGKRGCCGQWGHHESECNDNPANRKNNPVSYSNSKRPYPANDSSAGGQNSRLSKEELLANLKAKCQLEQNQYKAYYLEQEDSGKYDEEWSPKERRKKPWASIIEKVKPKNSKLNLSSSTYKSTSSPMDTEYSNLDTSANISLITELTDFLAT